MSLFQIVNNLSLGTMDEYHTMMHVCKIQPRLKPNLDPTATVKGSNHTQLDMGTDI